MPSASNTSVAEKLVHARMILRFALQRGRIDAIWDEPDHKAIFENFVSRCVQEADIDFQMLLRIHDDELLLLFGAFELPPSDRLVIRTYLNLPEDALWTIWTAVKAAMLVTVSLLRVSRRLFGIPGLLLLSAGVGIGLAGRRVRRDFVAEAGKMLERHQSLQRAVAPSLSLEVLADGTRLPRSAPSSSPSPAALEREATPEDVPQGNPLPESKRNRWRKMYDFGDPEAAPMSYSRTPRAAGGPTSGNGGLVNQHPVLREYDFTRAASEGDGYLHREGVEVGAHRQ